MHALPIGREPRLFLRGVACAQCPAFPPQNSRCPCTEGWAVSGLQCIFWHLKGPWSDGNKSAFQFKAEADSFRGWVCPPGFPHLSGFPCDPKDRVTAPARGPTFTPSWADSDRPRKPAGRGEDEEEEADTHYPPRLRGGTVRLVGCPGRRRPGPERSHSAVETTTTETARLCPAHWGWRPLLIRAACTLVRGAA